MKKLILILLLLFVPVACFAEGNEYQTGELENITNTVETTNTVDTDLQNDSVIDIDFPNNFLNKFKILLTFVIKM